MQLPQSKVAWDVGLMRVLEHDPDLGSVIDESEQPTAIAAAVAPVFEHDPGPWQFFPDAERGALGALILDGLIVVRVGASPRTHVELLGEGDLISPWVGIGSDLNLSAEVDVEVLSSMRIALLGRRFVLRTARWPELLGALFQRLVIRSRRLNLQAAINAVPRVGERLELTLWHLGDHFGRVTADGIILELPFTHALLAELIGAQRPSVSIAVKRLELAGRLVRDTRERWILCGKTPPSFSPLARQTGVRS